ncbi:MAG TPA: hypothetical protein DCS07_07645 [Bdellovibrionales bacterium]|nr:hypothetical protein [Bdellovibrionales bacterium]HCM40325.1 hypothetical protein [Bdellovibrionales bacterium]
MIHLLTKCPVCFSGVGRHSFPLCDSCADWLIPAPLLCPRCGQPSCVQAKNSSEPCQRPWVRQPYIESFSARYLLTTPTYTVLRRWKSLGGTFLDRAILKSDAELESRLASMPLTAIVPIPQQFARSWRLGGSPAERIALFLARITGLPVVHALAVPEQRKPKPQQAALSAEKRFENRIRFSVNQKIGGESVLLVDDFFTTGHTLRGAASTLYWAGARGIHVFCLGIRPARPQFRQRCASRFELQSDLMKGYRRTKGVSHESGILKLSH